MKRCGYKGKGPAIDIGDEQITEQQKQQHHDHQGSTSKTQDDHIAGPNLIDMLEGLSMKTPPPSGKNCPLCNRDLSCTPEGPVFQPKNPPVVACLPCGHMFHDHCLSLITPAHMGKDPPCIYSMCHKAES